MWLILDIGLHVNKGCTLWRASKMPFSRFCKLAILYFNTIYIEICDLAGLEDLFADRPLYLTIRSGCIHFPPSTTQRVVLAESPPLSSTFLNPVLKFLPRFSSSLVRPLCGKLRMDLRLLPRFFREASDLRMRAADYWHFLLILPA